MKPSTFDSYERNLRLHVLPRLGSHTLQQVTPSLLNRHVCRSVDRRSPQTARWAECQDGPLHPHDHQQGLSDAVDTGLIATNVLSVRNRREPAVRPSTEIRAWTPTQLRTVPRDGARGPARGGMAARSDDRDAPRRGAGCAMAGPRPRQRPACRCGRAVVSVAYKITISTPKSHQARVIDLDSVTCELLLENHGTPNRSERDDWGKDYHDNDLVFCKHDGTHLHPDSFSDAFKRLASLHSCPGSASTTCVTPTPRSPPSRCPVKVIAERLGHEDPAFTMKQYAHVIPGMQADAARLIADTVDTPTPNNRQNHAITPTTTPMQLSRPSQRLTQV